MRKFLTFFILGIILGGAFNWQLAGATSLKHDWRKYFGYESYMWGPSLGIVKMVVSPKGERNILECLFSSNYVWKFYVVKFDKTGKLIRKKLVPVNAEYYDMVLDREGNIYLAGEINKMACLVKLGSDCHLLSNIFFIEGRATSLCLDDLGYVYAVGTKLVEDITILSNLSDNTYTSYVFVAKFGSLHFSGPVWTEILCKTDYTDYNNYFLNQIVIDRQGNLYVGGMCSTEWGCPLRQFQGNKDAFVAKLAGNGNLIWNTFLGGTDNDGFKGIARDEKNNIAILGWSCASWSDPVLKFIAKYTWESNSFVACLDGNGQLLWNTFLGGACPSSWPSSSSLGGPAMDVQGNIYMIGQSVQSWGETPLWPYNDGLCYFAKINGQGNLLYHAFLLLKKPLPKDYDYDSTYASTIVLSQGSIFITGTCGWGMGGEQRMGETFAFLDKITEKNRLNIYK